MMGHLVEAVLVQVIRTRASMNLHILQKLIGVDIIITEFSTRAYFIVFNCTST